MRSNRPLSGQIVLTNDQHGPPFPAQSRPHAAVPRNVPLDLGPPPRAQVAVEVVALPAPVPEAAVYEDDAATTDEDKVGAARESLPGPRAVPVCAQVPEPASPERSRDAPLGDCAAPVGLHRLAALGASQSVRVT